MDAEAMSFDLDKMRKAVESPTTYKPAGVSPREWLLSDEATPDD
jgi:hypothetical protein